MDNSIVTVLQLQQSSSYAGLMFKELEDKRSNSARNVCVKERKTVRKLEHCFFGGRGAVNYSRISAGVLEPNPRAKRGMSVLKLM